MKAPSIKNKKQKKQTRKLIKWHNRFAVNPFFNVAIESKELHNQLAVTLFNDEHDRKSTRRERFLLLNIVKYEFNCFNKTYTILFIYLKKY